MAIYLRWCMEHDLMGEDFLKEYSEVTKQVKADPANVLSLIHIYQESREELEYLFREWEMEPQNPEEMIRESMAPVRQAAIGPMLVGRELEEINWEPVKMDDPRLTAHPDWLKEFRDFAWSDSSSLTLHQSARIEPVSYTHLDVYKRQVPDTDCNLPIFSSGWGDGYYPVYFGYDAKGEICAVYVRFIDIEACLLYTSRCV